MKDLDVLLNYLNKNNLKEEASSLKKIIKISSKDEDYFPEKDQLPIKFWEGDGNEYSFYPNIHPRKIKLLRQIFDSDYKDEKKKRNYGKRIVDDYEQIPLDFNPESEGFVNYPSHGSHYSARSRFTKGVITPSVPCQYLVSNNLINKSDKILDYGCGRGGDIEFLKSSGFENVDCYDLEKKRYSDGTYIEIINPQEKIGYYDVIMCNYVFNVLDSGIRGKVFNNIDMLLKNGGTAYIAVRGDVRQDYLVKGKGYWQYNVHLDKEDEIKDKIQIFTGKEEGLMKPQGFRLYKFKK